MTTSSSCPACSGEGIAAQYAAYGVHTCTRCGGIFTPGKTRILLQDSLRIVSGEWSTDADADERAKYFDLSWRTTAGDTGRRHGWYDPKTRKITQTG